MFKQKISKYCVNIPYNQIKAYIFNHNFINFLSPCVHTMDRFSFHPYLFRVLFHFQSRRAKLLHDSCWTFRAQPPPFTNNNLSCYSPTNHPLFHPTLFRLDQFMLLRLNALATSTTSTHTHSNIQVILFMFQISKLQRSAMQHRKIHTNIH